KITPQVFRRNGRPLWPEDQLRLIELSKESPLRWTIAIAAIPTAAATLWTLVQTAQTIENWPLQRAKLQAEVLKTQLEVEKLDRELHPHILIKDQRRLAATTGREAVAGTPRKIIQRITPTAQMAKVRRRLR